MSTTAPPPLKPARYLYFVNAPVDFAVIGGASMVVYLALLASGYHARSEPVWTLAAGLAWVVNWPHFSATNYRLYHSRENIAQYPFTALVVPVLVTAGVIGSFCAPEDVAPYFVKLFLFWSPYHFAAQSLGISLIYARRAGFAVMPWHRAALSGFIFGTYLFSTARAEVGTGTRPYFGIETPMLGLPSWVAVASKYGMYACGALFLILVMRWSLSNRRMLPPIVLLPAATQFLWFVPGNAVASFNEFVPFFHSLQYLLIAWSMQLKERLDLGGIAPSRKFVSLETFKWGMINIAGGAVLFWVLPRLGGYLGYPMGFAEPVIISAVQIHHFFVDGVIWKLRNPRVGSPLLVNIEQLVRPEPRPEPAGQPT